MATVLMRSHRARPTKVERAQNLLWVSTGSPASNPAQAIAQGWLRYLRYENTNAGIQYLTVVDRSCVTPSLIAETLLRLFLSTFENEYDSSVVWATESELRWQNGAHGVSPSN
ncbi:hypothetical protein BJX70DRAFT_399062 [Aspergillus crustosus]